jgi:hypothetical protein
MVVALAALAGNALVQAMVSDGWGGVRHKVAQLFGRSQPEAQIERRLDATRRQLEASDPADQENVRVTLAGRWETRFADLLADHPDAEAELSALVEEMSASVPVAAEDHSVAAGRDVNVRAEGESVAAAVIHGNVSAGPTQPGPASG